MVRYSLHLLMSGTGVSFSTKFHSLLADRRVRHGSDARVQRCWDDAVKWFNTNRLKPAPHPRAIPLTEGLLRNNTRSDGKVKLTENGIWLRSTVKPTFFVWRKDDVIKRDYHAAEKRERDNTGRMINDLRQEHGKVTTLDEKLAFANALITLFHGEDARPSSKRASKTLAKARKCANRLPVTDKKSKTLLRSVMGMLTARG